KRQGGRAGAAEARYGRTADEVGKFAQPEEQHGDGLSALKGPGPAVGTGNAGLSGARAISRGARAGVIGQAPGRGARTAGVPTAARFRRVASAAGWAPEAERGTFRRVKEGTLTRR